MNFFEFQKSLVEGKRGSAKPQAAGEEALTVSQLTQRIERTLKAGFPGSVWVKAEVSNFKHHGSSGHAYFTLKDPEACIDCVMFKSEFAKLKFEPGDGMELLVSGRVGVYGQRGRYQLYVTNMLPVGQGALELAFQQLRAKLEGEGLFEAGRKKVLPRYPRRIVMVTSRETAALQDMLKVLRRYAFLRLGIFHVPVQGDGAAEQIAAAIGRVNKMSGVDLILLGRGGGSLEDLWEFNEECVARAIVASRIAVVTGIGHEVDVSIADLVADHHAHTPTEAASIAVGQWRNAAQVLMDGEGKLGKGLRDLVGYYRQRIGSIERHEVFRRPMDGVNRLRQLVDDREKDLGHGMSDRLHVLQRRVAEASRRLEKQRPAALIERLRQRLEHRKHVLAMTLRSRVKLLGSELLTAERRLRNGSRVQRQALGKQLDSLEAQLRLVGPEQVLQRGYSITYQKKTGDVIRSVKQLKAGEKMVTRVADGEIESITEDSKQPGLFE